MTQETFYTYHPTSRLRWVSLVGTPVNAGDWKLQQAWEILEYDCKSAKIVSIDLEWRDVPFELKESAK